MEKKKLQAIKEIITTKCMSSKKRKIISGVVVAVVVLALLTLAVSGGKKVEYATASRTSVKDIYTEEGRLTFGKEYQVIAQVSGPVKDILVSENELVKKGQVLFTIDSTDYTYERDLAKSSLEGYEAQMEQNRINQMMTSSPQEYLKNIQQEMESKEAEYQNAKTVYDGGNVLYAAGAISQVEWEKQEADYKAALLAWQEAKGRYEESSRYLEELKKEGMDEAALNDRFYSSVTNQLKAQVEAKKTEVAQLEEKIGKCEVKSEHDGIVTSLPVNGMSMIQSGETGASLNCRDVIRAEADVLTNVAPYIQEGTAVDVVLQLRGKDETYAGTVCQIYDYASKGTSSLGLDEYRVHVKVELEDENALEGKEGYGVNLKFCLYNSDDCLTVPSSAVFKSDNQYYVYGVRAGKIVKIPIEMEYQTGVKTVISSGLSEGDRVIDHVGGEGIYEGVRVKNLGLF